MGAGPSVLASEVSKPHDCVDLATEEEARQEVVRLRKMIRDHQQVLESALEAVEVPQTRIPTGSASSPSRTRPANFARFDNPSAQAFTLNDSPELHDYLVNEFHRFENSATDQRLSWDGFWRFTRDLDLGLDDAAIAELRQKADVNRDGYVDWGEMVDVFAPILGKYWQANLAKSSDYAQWKQLHWETQHTVKKTSDGYTRRGKTFWVNKLTGESSWTLPTALQDHPSFREAIEAKKKRHEEPAPAIEAFVRSAFEHHSSKESMTMAQFWTAFDEELHLTFWLTPEEKSKLGGSVDANGDGKVSFEEFLVATVALLKSTFSARGGPEWIAMETTYEGLEYLYWYNRITGMSSWFPPKPTG